MPRPVKITAKRALGPVHRRSVAEVNRKVVTVNTQPPMMPNFQKVWMQAKPAIRGRMPKLSTPKIAVIQ